jgi:hypothetical protein
VRNFTAEVDRNPVEFRSRSTLRNLSRREALKARPGIGNPGLAESKWGFSNSCPEIVGPKERIVRKNQRGAMGREFVIGDLADAHQFGILKGQETETFLL